MYKTDDIESTLDKFLATKYETETIEFKEAKDNFSFDELGKYFSALSNEANLHNAECAWLVFGVEDKKHTIVGTNYRSDAKSLNSLKVENFERIRAQNVQNDWGKRESEDLILPALSQITWILKDRDSVVKDYEHFFCPLIISAERVQAKIRNLTYRYMTGDSIFPKETLQYDPYSIREALNNCIAHQDYSKAGRITIQEHEDDYLIFCNRGDFIPGSIENVLKAEYSASNYRNPFLATAMVNLNMIDTVGSGILKMFLAQKKRCFPLPDYDFSNHEVRMKLYGKVLDINYTKRLLTEDLSLNEVLKLDKEQKESFLKNLPKATENDKAKVAQRLPRNCPEIAQRTYLYIAENPNATIKEIHAALGISERTVKNHLALLKDKFIKRIGSDTKGHWEILTGVKDK